MLSDYYSYSCLSTISRIHLTRLAVPANACTSRVGYDDTLDYNELIFFDNIYFPFISTDESFAMTTNTRD